MQLFSRELLICLVDNITPNSKHRNLEVQRIDLKQGLNLPFEESGQIKVSIIKVKKYLKV